MSHSDDTHYLGIVLEDIRDELKTVHEVVAQTQDDMKKLATKEELQVVADELKVAIAVLTDHNSELADHETRITKLEAPA